MKVFVSRIVLFLSAIVRSTQQTCPEEVSKEGISVTWHKTPTAHNIESDPLCYRDETLITRNCSRNGWVPSLNDVGPCLKVVKYLDVNSCPPGFHKVSENINEFCYQIGDPSVWDSPCFSSGGASVITDLSEEEVQFLLNSLRSTNTSNYFWLPAARQRLFHPVVWTIPGPNWGQRVIPSGFLNLYTPFTKNCLLLDVEHEALVTDVCTKSYPALCFYINDHYYPSRCPDGYQSFRFKHDNGTCFGIEKAEPGMSFNEFLQNKCKTPMVNINSELSRFVFKKISELNNLTNDMWCWLATYKDSYENYDETESMSSNNSQIMKKLSHEGIVNSAGVLGFINSNAALPCMACEVEIAYGKTEFMFEYNEAQNKIFLTVYYPSGLWKYDNTDKGIQCFSDAKGFFRVVDVNDLPFMEANSSLFSDIANIEKIVYVIDLVTDSSAQYWCEGHTIDFNFLTTDKIIANPKGNKIHVFALVIKYYVLLENVEEIVDLTGLTNNITDIFSAKKVLLMDVIDYSLDHMIILLHLHVDVNDIYEDEALNIQETYNNLTLIAKSELPKYNYIFVNLSSSAVCLPTTSENVNELDWEMTPIGHISAPKQFCLQANGLPVKRHCKGSYETGGVWGEVEGSCDSTYAPSEATAFLYNFVKRQMPNKYASKFLTDGLNFVLSDTDIIIPADIYYLSMSLQHVLDIAEQNSTSVDTGDIENIAWVMDRMMVLDCNYLRLAQTLNSTNVILDSVSDIIELIAQRTLVDSAELSNISYQFALKPQFIVQITYPEYNNITGIAVIRNSVSDNFADMVVQPLYKNTSIDDVLSIERLEIATWLPEKVLSTLQKNTNESDENTMVGVSGWKAVPANQATYALRSAHYGPTEGLVDDDALPRVTTGLPHHSKAPRVVLVHKQFVIGTAADMLHLPKNYKLGNIVFGDYERDEEDCGLTLQQIKIGIRCPRAYIEIPPQDITPHPEYTRFGVGNSLALIKLIRPLKSPVPRDFDSERLAKKSLRLYTHRECKQHRMKARLGSEGVTHVLCSSGCGVRPGATIISHSSDGPFELIGLAAGGAPCHRRSMRRRLNNEPPLYIDVFPYNNWIMNVITAHHLPKPYPNNFMLADAGPEKLYLFRTTQGFFLMSSVRGRSDVAQPTGIGINKSYLRKRRKQKSGWRARTFMTGNFCYLNTKFQKLASYFYSEKFEVNADPPAKLNVILKAYADCYAPDARVWFWSSDEVTLLTVSRPALTVAGDHRAIPDGYCKMLLEAPPTAVDDTETGKRASTYGLPDCKQSAPPMDTRNGGVTSALPTS
ncbi:unnamed protein product [Spodoptera exigua]|nr:unnamed protein product [Spodoptera exigua]